MRARHVYGTSGRGGGSTVVAMARGGGVMGSESIGHDPTAWRSVRPRGGAEARQVGITAPRYRTTIFSAT